MGSTAYTILKIGDLLINFVARTSSDFYSYSLEFEEKNKEGEYEKDFDRTIYLPKTPELDAFWNELNLLHGDSDFQPSRGFEDTITKKELYVNRIKVLELFLKYGFYENHASKVLPILKKESELI